MLLERTKEGHRQLEEHWNFFKGNVSETSERRGGAHTYRLFRAHRHHLELNRTEPDKQCTSTYDGCLQEQ